VIQSLQISIKISSSREGWVFQ